jgi:glycosyltransferase involved in cell wall biosynthesis
MKIAYNAWFLEPSLAQNTGTGQYARHLADAITEIAPDVQLEFVEPRRRSDLGKLAFEQFEFPNAARRMKADVAFVPYWGPPLSSAVPVVTTIHDVIQVALPEYRGRVHHRAYFSLARAGALAAAAVITDSQFSRDDIVRHLGVSPERLHVAPLAAEAHFSPAQPDDDLQRVREAYDLPEQYVLYLGGFDRRKNIETLLQVYVWCGDAIGEEFPLVMTGSPDDLAWTAAGDRMPLGRMVQELEIADVVRFIGRPPEYDKAALYAGARAFLYPTLYEGFGLPALEAMASGVPVVGGNSSSVAEVVGNSGTLVDPLDARAMAGALISVCIQDDLHERLRRRAVLRAAEFSWQRTAYETLAVLKQVGVREEERGKRGEE